MQYINLTPHSITIDGEEHPPSGTVARIDFHVSGTIGTTSTRMIKGAVGVPDEQRKDVRYIVSLPTALMYLDKGRSDIYTVADHIRDGEGRIIGASGLTRWAGVLPPKNSVWKEDAAQWVPPHLADWPGQATPAETWPGAYD